MKYSASDWMVFCERKISGSVPHILKLGLLKRQTWVKNQISNMSKDAIRFPASFYKHLSPRISCLPQILNQTLNNRSHHFHLSNFQPAPTMFLYSYPSIHFHVLSVFPLSPCFSPPRATCIFSSPHLIYPTHFLKFACSWIYGEVTIKSITPVMLLEVPGTGRWFGSRQKGPHVNFPSYTLRHY